jgi:hypothetical protein
VVHRVLKRLESFAIQKIAIPSIHHIPTYPQISCRILSLANCVSMAPKGAIFRMFNPAGRKKEDAVEKRREQLRQAQQ